MFWFEKYNYATLTWGNIHAGMFRDNFLMLWESEQVPKSLTQLNPRLVIKADNCTPPLHLSEEDSEQNPPNQKWVAGAISYFV